MLKVIEEMTIFLQMFKVWDAVTGARMFNFEGHEASVYSVYPHRKENIHVRTNI